MPSKIYEKINKIYDFYLNLNKSFNSDFINKKIELYKLLLTILNDYNNDDNKFYLFYLEKLSKIELKNYYNTILFNPYRKIYFNSFNNLNEFIDIICSSINNETFYIEIIEVLKNN